MVRLSRIIRVKRAESVRYGRVAGWRDAVWFSGAELSGTQRNQPELSGTESQGRVFTLARYDGAA